MTERIAAAVRSMVSRGKVTAARMGPRTLLQITGLEGEVVQTVELLLPPGYSARPLASSDITTLQVLGSRDHLVAIGGDMAGNAIADLAPGEFGLTDGIQTIVVRNGFLEMNTPTYVKITAGQYVDMETPLLKVSGDIIDNYDGGNSQTMAQSRGTYNMHTHNIPNVQSGDDTVTTQVPNQIEE